MRKSASRTSVSTLSSVIDLLVEHRIRLDALEHVLKETNPLAHDLYFGAVKNLQAQEAAELKQALTARLKSKLGKG
jgi:hypothetical protein